MAAFFLPPALPRLAAPRLLFRAELRELFLADFLELFLLDLRADERRADFLAPFLADFRADLLLDFFADFLAPPFLAVFLRGRVVRLRADESPASSNADEEDEGDVEGVLSIGSGSIQPEPDQPISI